MTIDTQLTGYAQAVARVREITAPLQPATSATPATGDFAGQLSSAMKPSAAGGAPSSAAGYTTQATAGVDPAALQGGSGTGARIAAIATAELGVAEQPPGSNDAPRIAQYRTATAGSGRRPLVRLLHLVGGPAGRGAGRPQRPGHRLRPDGQGLGGADRPVHPRGQRRPPGRRPGRLRPRRRRRARPHRAWSPAPGRTAASSTVEGNSSDKVSARSYGPGGYTGLVRVAPQGG